MPRKYQLEHQNKSVANRAQESPLATLDICRPTDAAPSENLAPQETTSTFKPNDSDSDTPQQELNNNTTSSNGVIPSEDTYTVDVGDLALE